MLEAAFIGLGVALALAAITWVASLVWHDVSIVDRVWSILIASAGFSYAVTLDGWRGDGLRLVLMLAVLLAWALRLSIYITRRNWRQPEDARYQAIRARNQPHFAWKSLVFVFALQALLAWVVSMPFLTAAAQTGPLGAWDVGGLLLAAFGVVFEAVADAQMAHFKSKPEHKGQVMDRGLWRYSRHPNYFGECCIWWGLWITALGASGGLWTVVSPLLMTVLLLKVSGVSLLEKDIVERRPAYRDYIARTPAFVPGPPRRAQ